MDHIHSVCYVCIATKAVIRVAYLRKEDIEMNKDDLIRHYNATRGSWQAVVGVYALIVSSLFLSASAVM